MYNKRGQKSKILTTLFMLNQRRGQGLSTNAMILIILGVIVLAVLVLGFTLGWGRILPFISTNNVDSIVTACGVACATGSQFGFCSQERELKAGDVTLKDVTCSFISEERKQYGVGACSSITCSGIFLSEKLTLDEAKIDCVGRNEDDIVQYFDPSDNTLKSHICTLEDTQSSG